MGTLLPAADIEDAARDLAADLGQQLHEVGYGAALVERTEAIAPRQFDAVRLPLVLEYLESLRDPSALAARFFSYRDALTTAELEQALGGQLAGRLDDAGFIETSDAGRRSRVRILPFDGMLLAADEADASWDPVMAVGATTAELARTLPDVVDGTLLDMGCGCGALALAGARRGADAIGLDIDPRAVAWSRFNAGLNAIDAHFETSDMFAAVGERRFDLVVCQPPFVPCPDPDLATTYLHGGARGDELAFRIVSALPRHLADDGRALLLFDVPSEDAPLWERVRTAVGDDGLDLVVIATPGHTAEQAAVGYAVAVDGRLGSRYAATAATYRRHLRALGVSRVTHALVVLTRRTDAAPRVSLTLNPRSLAEYDATGLADLDRSLRLAAQADDVLEASVVGAAAGAVLVQRDGLRDRDAPGLEVEFRHGRGESAALSDAAAILLQLARQPRTVGALVHAFADAADATPEAVRGSVLTFVRDGLVRGLLTAARE